MTMTKKARSEAAKKAARTRKRNANLSSSKKPVRRRRKTASKGFLSQIGGIEGRNAFKSMASGAVGGTLYLVYEDQVDLGTSTPEKKGAVAVLGAYFLATMGKKPNTAAGIVGAAAYDFFKEKGLLNDPADSQMSRVEYADPLQNIPISLSDDAMYLAQSGDMSLAEAVQMDLADNGGDYQYLPDYAATYNY